MLQYAEYARLFEQSHPRLDDHTAADIAYGLMFRYESAAGSLTSDVEMLLERCGTKAERILLECLKYVRKVYSPHSWQYYNILFETAWVFFRNGHLKPAVGYYRAALVMNCDDDRARISPLYSVFINDQANTDKNLDAFLKLLQHNTSYSPGTRKSVLSRHIYCAAQTFEEAGCFIEAEKLLKKLCDEKLKFGDIYCLEQLIDLCRLYIRMGELVKADAYCNAAEKLLRDNRRVSSEAVSRVRANRATLLFLGGDFLGAYQLVYQEQDCPKFFLEQRLDFEILFNYILFLVTGEVRASKLDRIQEAMISCGTSDTACILKMLVGLHIENIAADDRLMYRLSKKDMKQSGSYINGLRNYFLSIIYIRQNPSKALAMLKRAEECFDLQYAPHTGHSFPLRKKVRLLISVVEQRQGTLPGESIDMQVAGVIYEWISSISCIDAEIERKRFDYAADLLYTAKALLRSVRGTSVKLYAVIEFLKRYIDVFSGEGTLSARRKAELEEYIEALTECISYFGSQDDFGICFISSGDDAFLDEYLSELSDNRI